MHASNQLNVVLQIVPPQPVPSNQARNMVKGVQHFWTSFSSNGGSKLVSKFWAVYLFLALGWTRLRLWMAARRGQNWKMNNIEFNQDGLGQSSEQWKEEW